MRRRWFLGLCAALIVGAGPVGISAAHATTTGNTLGGTVYDLQSSTVLSGICAQVNDVSDPNNGPYVQVSQADGTWQQPFLPDGTYNVEFFDCRGSDYPFWFLGNTPLSDHATHITLMGGESRKGLQIHMPPGGAVSGTVTDAKRHQPIVDTLVEMYYPTLMHGEQAYAGFACTDSTGFWKMGGAPVTGVKVVAFGNGCNGETYNYRITWFSDARTFHNAAIVPISANQETTGVNQQLKKA